MTDSELQNLDSDSTLIAGWAVPNEGPLSEAERRAVMRNFAAYVEKCGLSVPDAAESASLKPVTIRELLKGAWNDKADGHVRALNDWVEQHARRAVHTIKSGFVSTHVAKQIGLAARLTRENSVMGLVFGPSGIGKTRCAMAVQQATVGSIYLRIDEDCRIPKTLISALAVKVEALDYQRRAGDSLFRRLVTRLADSGRLLIIDEANILSEKGLRTLRDLHDETGCPILLIAVRDLHDRILADAKPDSGQLYSRFGVVMNVTEGRESFYAGGKPLFTIDDIRALYEHVPIRLAKDAAEYLKDVANALGWGSLRRCRIIVQNAARRSRSRQGLGVDDPVTVSAADLDWVERALRQEAGEQETIEHRTVSATALAM